MNCVRNFRYTARLAAIGVITVATACASSTPDDHETWRCNTAQGQSDGKVFMIPGDAMNISGKIAFHSADTGPEWASVAKVVVHQRGAHYDDDDCGCNGIAVYAYKQPDHVEFDITSGDTDAFIAPGPYETPISFKISISPQNVMAVTIGHTNPVIKTIVLRHPEHNSLEMSCSGADVSFYDSAAL